MKNKTLHKKLDKLRRLENPFRYWRKKWGKNARFCLHQACDECFDTAGIVLKSHIFAGALNPNKFPHLDKDYQE